MTEKNGLRMTRRRYGDTTYTWVEAYVKGEAEGEGQWLSLGDPWPYLNPPRKDVDLAIAAVKRALAKEADR